MGHVPIAVRYLIGHRMLMAGIIVLQVLVAFAMVFSHAPPATIDLEVEQIQLNADLLQAYPSQFEAATSRSESIPNDRNAQLIEHAERIGELHEQGATTELYRALADYYAWDYEGRTDAARVSNRYNMALYAALAEHPGTKLYERGDQIPLLVWAASAQKGYLLPLAGHLPFLQGGDVDGSQAYNALFDTVLWVIPIVFVSAVAARLQRRGHLAAVMPAGPVRTLFSAGVAAAVSSLFALLLIWLPGIVIRIALGGLGDPGYPIVYGADSYIQVTSAGQVVAETACLVVLAAIAISLLMHLAVTLFDTPLPALALTMAALLILGMYPEYFTRFSAFRNVAHLLPFTYFNTEYAVGVFEGFPQAHELRQVTFAAGVGAIALFIAVIAVLLALAAWRTRRSGVRRVPGSFPSVQIPVGPTFARRDGDAHMGKHFKRATSRSVPESACGSVVARGTCLQCASGYVLVCLSLAARSRLLLGSTGLLTVLLLILLGFPLYSDMSRYSASYYRDEPLSQISQALAAGAYDGDDAARRDAEGLQEQLLAIVRAQGRRDQYREIAAYERYRLALAEQGSSLAPNEREVRDAAPRALLLEELARLDAVAYAIPNQMPAIAYLSYVTGKIPFPVLLLPACALAFEIARQRVRPLLRQAPAPAVAKMLGSLAIVVPLAVVAYGAAAGTVLCIAAVRNGWGDPAYPAVLFEGGAWKTVPCGVTLFQGLLLAVAVSILLVALTLCVVQACWNKHAAAIALACTIVLSALTASIYSGASRDAARLAVGMLPVSYLDIPGTVGCVAYTFEGALGLSLLWGVLSCAVWSAAMVLITAWQVWREKGRAYAAHS